MSFQVPHRIVYALQPKTAAPNKSILLFWECVHREFAHRTPFGSILLPEEQNRTLKKHRRRNAFPLPQSSIFLVLQANRTHF